MTRIVLTQSLKDLGLQCARDIISREGSLERELFFVTLSSIKQFATYCPKGSYKETFGTEEKKEEEDPLRTNSTSSKDGSEPLRPPPLKTHPGIKYLTKSSSDKATAVKRFGRAKKATRALMCTVKGYNPLKVSTRTRIDKKLQVSVITSLHFAKLYNSIIKLRSTATSTHREIPADLPTKVPQEFLTFWTDKGLKAFHQPKDQGGNVYLNMQNPKNNEPLSEDNQGYEFLQEPLPDHLWKAFKACQETDMEWVKL
jgi:hypothetical protein